MANNLESLLSPQRFRRRIKFEYLSPYQIFNPQKVQKSDILKDVTEVAIQLQAWISQAPEPTAPSSGRSGSLWVVEHPSDNIFEQQQAQT